jgi:hypothetical protein
MLEDFINSFVVRSQPSLPSSTVKYRKEGNMNKMNGAKKA